MLRDVLPVRQGEAKLYPRFRTGRVRRDGRKESDWGVMARHRRVYHGEDRILPDRRTTVDIGCSRSILLFVAGGGHFERWQFDIEY